MLDVDSGIGDDEAMYEDPKMFEKQLAISFRYVLMVKTTIFFTVFN